MENMIEKIFGKDGFNVAVADAVGGRKLPEDIEDSIYFGSGERAEGKKNKRKSLVKFYLGTSLVEKMSLKPGDRVAFYYSRKKNLGALAPDQKGYIISKPSGSHLSESRRGEYCLITIPSRNGMPSCDLHSLFKLENVTIDSNQKTIIFNFPREVYF